MKTYMLTCFFPLTFHQGKAMTTKHHHHNNILKLFHVSNVKSCLCSLIKSIHPDHIFVNLSGVIWGNVSISPLYIFQELHRSSPQSRGLGASATYELWLFLHAASSISTRVLSLELISCGILYKYIKYKNIDSKRGSGSEHLLDSLMDILPVGGQDRTALKYMIIYVRFCWGVMKNRTKLLQQNSLQVRELIVFHCFWLTICLHIPPLRQPWQP